MPRALKVTKKNLEDIVLYGKSLGFDLSYLSDNLEIYTEDYGMDLYVITDGFASENNVTFTEMGSSDFNRIWKFAHEEFKYAFAEIVKR